MTQPCSVVGLQRPRAGSLPCSDFDRPQRMRLAVAADDPQHPAEQPHADDRAVQRHDSGMRQFGIAVRPDMHQRREAALGLGGDQRVGIAAMRAGEIAEPRADRAPAPRAPASSAASAPAHSAGRDCADRAPALAPPPRRSSQQRLRARPRAAAGKSGSPRPRRSGPCRAGPRCRCHAPAASAPSRPGRRDDAPSAATRRRPRPSPPPSAVARLARRGLHAGLRLVALPAQHRAPGVQACRLAQHHRDLVRRFRPQAMIDRVDHQPRPARGRRPLIARAASAPASPARRSPRARACFVAGAPARTASRDRGSVRPGICAFAFSSLSRCMNAAAAWDSASPPRQKVRQAVSCSPAPASAMPSFSSRSGARGDFS